jgi:hypothetical protein
MQPLNGKYSLMMFPRILAPRRIHDQARPVNARLENWLQPPLKRSGRMLPPLPRNSSP